MTEVKFDNLPSLARKMISSSTFYPVEHAYFEDDDGHFYVDWKKTGKLIKWDNNRKQWQ